MFAWQDCRGLLHAPRTLSHVTLFLVLKNSSSGSVSMLLRKFAACGGLHVDVDVVAWLPASGTFNTLLLLTDILLIHSFGLFYLPLLHHPWCIRTQDGTKG